MVYESVKGIRPVDSARVVVNQPCGFSLAWVRLSAMTSFIPLTHPSTKGDAGQVESASQPAILGCGVASLGGKLNKVSEGWNFLLSSISYALQRRS